MDLKKEIEEVLKKKALGFSYTEEVVEYETVRPKPWVFCELRGRLYSKRGYICVKPLFKADELVGVERKFKGVFSDNKKIFERLKAFKLKGFRSSW